MSFRLRQRGKDAGKTTSLHFLVPHAASKPFSRRTREAMNADPSMHTKDRAKPSLKTPSVKTSEQGEVLKPAFKSDRGAAAAPCRLLQPTKVSTSWLATWPLQNYPVAGGNIENSSEIVFWERLFVIVSVLPALMSRSSWFAGPSCSEVAMFSLAARITPPLGEISSDSARVRRQSGILPPPYTGNPCSDLLLQQTATGREESGDAW